jgi:hypothetical protein
LQRLTPAQTTIVAQKLKLLAAMIGSPDCSQPVPQIDLPSTVIGSHPSSAEVARAKAFSEDVDASKSTWSFVRVDRTSIARPNEAKRLPLDFQVSLQVPPTYPHDAIIWELKSGGPPGSELTPSILNGLTNAAVAQLAAVQQTDPKPIRMHVVLAVIYQ